MRSRLILRLRDILDNPRELLECEYKAWLDLSRQEDCANLAQALALANHGGGYIVIGFMEKDGKWIPAGSRPGNLASYRQDVVNNIVHAYADPSFHCDVEFVPATATSEEYPVVVVPGGHKVPIRAKKDGPNGKHVHQNAYYIRRPGPRSEQPASGREWDELIGRCLRTSRNDLLDNIRAILEAPRAFPKGIEGSTANLASVLAAWAEQSFARADGLAADLMAKTDRTPYVHGVWSVAYLVDGSFDHPNPAALLNILRSVKGRETGWPPWIVLDRSGVSPYLKDGLVECWLGKDPSNPGMSDFWRASPDGKLYLLRSHQEDTGMSEHPKTVLDLILPVWRVGESLLHAGRLAEALGVPDSDIHVSCRWTGLAGRIMKALANQNRLLFERHEAVEDVVTTYASARASAIDAQLPELTRSLTEPLYQAFDFFTPPAEMYREELAVMRGRAR